MSYETITDQLNTYISSQIAEESDWTNVPGGLDKVSASSLGYVWGIGQSKIWICQMPCLDGNWKPVESPLTTVIDIITDDANVYVLGNQGSKVIVLTKSANNSGDWISIDAPAGANFITLTNSYIWTQTPSLEKYRLAKPGTTGNWISIPDKSGVKITSSSISALYGVDSSGNPAKSDESLQSGWSIIPEFGTKVQLVQGSADNIALYGVDMTSKVLRCANKKCAPISTEGYKPKFLSLEPSTQQVWMTTSETGQAGNIFTKSDSPNYSAIMSTTNALDKQRDEIVNEVEQQYTQTTQMTAMEQTIEDVSQKLKQFFGIKPVVKDIHHQNISAIQEKIDRAKDHISQLQSILPVLQKLIFTIVAAAIVYLFGSLLGWVTHFIALLVVIAGGLYTYFSHT